jgi:large subunit ribosomal protein L25
MERPALSAEVREGVGKEKANKLRVKGMIPAIFYGPRSNPIPLVVDAKEFTRTLQTEAGENVLIDLDIRKAGQSERKVVMVKESSQLFRGTPLHRFLK